MQAALNAQEFRQLEYINVNLSKLDSTLKTIAQHSSKQQKDPQADELIAVLKELNKSIQNVGVIMKEESAKTRDVILKK